jgi:hydrogenase maturation factor
MYKLLCHPGRTFTLEELIDQTQAVRGSIFDKQTRALPVSDINLNPVIDPNELDFLAGLVPFHHISNNLLFKLVRVATGFEVRDRWIAIRAIIAKRIPIPVPKSLTEVRHG